MNRKIILITLAIAASAPLLQSCNQLSREFNETMREAKEEGMPRYLRDSDKWGKVVKQSIDLDDFSSIRTHGNVDVVYVQTDDETTSILVEGNEKVLPMYDIALTSDKEWLEVTAKDQKEMRHRVPHIRMTVSMPRLEAMEINGAGDFFIRQKAEFIDSPLHLRINGAGDIRITDLSCTDFLAEINGAGDLDIGSLSVDENIAFIINGAGDTNVKEAVSLGNANISLSGAGDIKVKLKCQDLTVNVSGAGEAKIEVKSQSVDAIAEGTGEIELKGSTHTFSKKTGGLAKIDSKNLEVDTIRR